MKKLLAYVAFMCALTCSLTQLNAAQCPECQFCLASGPVTTERLNISAVSNQIASCQTNSGSITVNVCNNISSGTVSLELSGEATQSSPSIPVAIRTCASHTFTGLPNGSYTVNATFSFPNGEPPKALCHVVVKNRKLNCLPLLCCCR